MAQWHYQLKGHEFDQTLGDSEGQGLRASLVAQTVKYLSAMQETWVRSLGWEDPLEKEMAAHASSLAWKISWTCGAW